MIRLRSAALTDIGRVRRNNEDRVLHVPGAGLFGVADGVGGLPGGAEAAHLASQEIVAGIADAGEGLPDLTALVHRANHHVRALGARLSPTFGIGTTLTFGVVREAILHLAHVGDSRCYGWRAGECAALTEDHSVENEARLRRARGEVVYYHDANRNALTRCIGQTTPPSVDLIDRPLLAGDRYLFCTDGVFRVIRDTEIGALLSREAEPEAILRDLIDLALRRGGPDNATAVLLVVDAIA